MRVNQIKIGEPYAVSNQRDAVPGTPGWAWLCGIVRETRVDRPDDEKVSRLYREPGESRTDGVRIDVVDPADHSHVLRTEIVRTRDVKAAWEEHRALLEANERRAAVEAEREQAERERVEDQVRAWAEGYLTESQVAARWDPHSVRRATSAEVERIADHLLVVRQNRGDIFVLHNDEDVYTAVQDDQSGKGTRAARLDRLSVVGGTADEWALLAAVLFLRAEQGKQVAV